MSCSSSVSVVSKCFVFPSKESTLGDLKLSVSDLRMLPVPYIRSGCLFTRPPFPISKLISLLKNSLSNTLTQFPPLAGRLITDSNGFIYITCNDEGVEFIQANAPDVHIHDILGLVDVPEPLKEIFALRGVVNYEGHTKPIAAVQVTELADGVFICCSLNHAVVDGTSFWNFFNSFADASRGIKRISQIPDFSRESVLISSAVLKFPPGGPRRTISTNAPTRDSVFSFSKESMSKLKAKANYQECDFETTQRGGQRTTRISSFQALCALLWRGVTRARNLPYLKTTTVHFAVDCRGRLEPKLEPLYFGNATQSIVTHATAGEVLAHDLRWCAEQVSIDVGAHDNLKVRKLVGEWEQNPLCISLGNLDGSGLIVAGSPRLPIYDNDFGWGRPIAIQTDWDRKLDGMITVRTGRKGNGSVDMRVILAPETMGRLESDPEFMQYVSDTLSDSKILSTSQHGVNYTILKSQL